MTLDNNTIRLLEVALLLGMGLGFASTDLIGRAATRLLLGALTLIFLIGISYRGVDYNSDTRNYASYVELLGTCSWAEYFYVSKFEPLHLFLISISHDLNSWLLNESLLAFAAVVILLCKVRRGEVLAVIFGCSLPLMTSSVRFAVGLLFFSACLTVLRPAAHHRFVTTVIGAGAHISLAVVALLGARKWFVTLATVALLIVIAIMFDNLGERVRLSPAQVIHLSGVRTMLAAIVFWQLFRDRPFIPGAGPSTSDLVSMSLLFVAASCGFPVLNRCLILYLIILADVVDQGILICPHGRPRSSVFSTGLYALLVVPAVVSSSLAINSNVW